MKIEYFQKLAKSMIEGDDENIDLYNKIDVAHSGGNELPPAIKNLPWMLEIKVASVADAFGAARRAMLSSQIVIDVLPPDGNEKNAAAAEVMERVLDYNFQRANKRSPINPFSAIISDVVRYMSVAFQVIDNEYQYKGMKGHRMESILRGGRFTWEVHDRKTVHARYNSTLLECVVLGHEVTIQQLIDRFGDENKGMQKLKAEFDSDPINNGADFNESTIYHFDYVDYDKKAEWASYDEHGGGDAYVFYNGENKLGFIPWVFRCGSEPIAKTTINTNQLDNLKVMQSMRYALIAATVAQARTWSKTLNGNGVEVDHSNPDAQLQLAQGEEAGVLPPSQTDPNLNVIIGTSEGAIQNSLSVSGILSSTANLAANMPYSTMSALIQLALASLVEVRQMIESAIEDGLYLQLCWLKETNKDLMGRRMKQKGMYDETMMLGAALSISPDSYDLLNWNISVQLKPNSPTDRAERMSFALNVSKQLNMPRAWALENAGVEDDPGVSLQKWSDEQIEIANTQAKVQEILGMVQIKLQQQMQASQPQPQTPPSGNAPAPLPNAAMTGSGGLPPPAMQNPNSTFETQTGQTRDGFPTAGA